MSSRKMRAKRQLMRLIAGVVIVIAVVICLIFFFTGGFHKKSDKIADRIYIGEVSVGGMTEEEAKEAVEKYVDGLAQKTVTLKASGKSVDVQADQLGLSCKNVEDLAKEALDYGQTGNVIERHKASKELEKEDKVFPLQLQADKDKTEAFLKENEETLSQEPVDYGLKRENGEFTVIKGQSGIIVDTDESLKTINEYFSEGWNEQASIELSVKEEAPKGSEEELSKVKDVLGTFHTDFSSSASGRKANVKNATSKINGTLLYPGEEFSVYDAISPMDAENGYELAGSYENGTTVQTYGGGVCQVSTTLYNAIIRAELEVTERYAHSMIVNYVKPSSDAAIAGTSKNLKFKNNQKAPVYIEGYTSGGVLYFTIYGQETRDPNREVIFESETTGTTEAGVQFKATSAAVGSISKVQSAHQGKTAQLWKIVKVNGVEQSREVFNKSTYKASPTIYEVGTSSENPEATAAMKAAIASNDLGTVQSAAAQWKNVPKKEETTANPTDSNGQNAADGQNQNAQSGQSGQQGNANTQSGTTGQAQ